MKNRKAFLIYIIVSLTAFTFAIIPKSEGEYYDYLKEQFNSSTYFIENYSTSQLNKLKRQINAYPEYSNYLKKAQQVDSVTKVAIQSENPDLLVINSNFLCLIERQEESNS